MVNTVLVVKTQRRCITMYVVDSRGGHMPGAQTWAVVSEPVVPLTEDTNQVSIVDGIVLSGQC